MKCLIHGGQEVGRELLISHHKHPTGYGGPDIASNIVLICATCHTILHKMEATIYAKKMGKATDLANQLLPHDPRRREILIKLASQAATAKRVYHENNHDEVPDDPDAVEEKEREIIVSLSLPESVHQRLASKASEFRHENGRKVGLYRYCSEVLRKHVEEESQMPRTVKVPEQWDL